VDPDQGIRAGGVSCYQSDMALSVQDGLIANGGEEAVLRGHAHLGDPADELLILHPVADQALDGQHLQAVLLGEALELWEPGHGAVIVHDLHNHPSGLEPCQPGQVDAGLRMPRPPQNSPLFGLQGEQMAGGDNIVSSGHRIDQGMNGRRPVECGNAGGGIDPGIHRNGKSGAHGLGVLAGHQGNVQLAKALGGHRHAYQTPAKAGHEIDGLRGHILRCHHQVPLVLPVLVVQYYYEATGADIGDRLLYSAKWHMEQSRSGSDIKILSGPDSCHRSFAVGAAPFGHRVFHDPVSAAFD